MVMIVALGALLVLFAAGAYILSGTLSRFRSVSIALMFLQLTAHFGSFKFQWPSALKETLSSLSFSNFNVDTTMVSTKRMLKWGAQLPFV